MEIENWQILFVKFVLKIFYSKALTLVLFPEFEAPKKTNATDLPEHLLRQKLDNNYPT